MEGSPLKVEHVEECSDEAVICRKRKRKKTVQGSPLRIKVECVEECSDEVGRFGKKKKKKEKHQKSKSSSKHESKHERALKIQEIKKKSHHQKLQEKFLNDLNVEQSHEGMCMDDKYGELHSGTFRSQRVMAYSGNNP